MKAFLFFFSTLLLNLVSNEIFVSMESWSRKIVRWAANRMPHNLRSRFEEEWDGVLHETPGNLGKFLFALNCCWAAIKTPNTPEVRNLADCDDSEIIPWATSEFVDAVNMLMASTSPEEIIEMSEAERADFVRKLIFDGGIPLKYDNAIFAGGRVYKEYLLRSFKDELDELDESKYSAEEWKYHGAINAVYIFITSCIENNLIRKG